MTLGLFTRERIRDVRSYSIVSLPETQGITLLLSKYSIRTPE